MLRIECARDDGELVVETEPALHHLADPRQGEPGPVAWNLRQSLRPLLLMDRERRRDEGLQSRPRGHEGVQRIAIGRMGG